MLYLLRTASHTLHMLIREYVFYKAKSADVYNVPFRIVTDCISKWVKRDAISILLLSVSAHALLVGMHSL